MGVLGFFDSGLGGLSVVREIRQAFARYSFVYLGDNARTPYGSRSRDEIYRYTLDGVIELIDRGADLIVLACNTSSSVALRRIQQEFLPTQDPAKRVLGIVIPTAEDVCALSGTKTIGILATEATVASQAYPQEIAKVDARVRVVQQACPLLVPLIESGALSDAEHAARDYIDALLRQDPRIDTLLLGCTHYALIERAIRPLVPPAIRLVSQGRTIADKLADYLRRHPDMDARLDASGRQTFLTTAYTDRIQGLANRFFGHEIALQTVALGENAGRRLGETNAGPASA